MDLPKDMLSKQTNPSFVALCHHPYSTSPVENSSTTFLGFEKSLEWKTKGQKDSSQSRLLLQFVMIRGNSSPHQSVMRMLAFSFALASSAVACCAPGALGLETRLLRLGQELTREKLPFRGGDGKCLYELMDMKGAHWYEVKISYPASTPAVFSIDLLPEQSEDSTSSARKLLNTEKIIFHLPEESASQDIQVGKKQRVLVSVKPEGFVAQPYVGEQEFIIYNILLEEVVLGIPLQAFWVGFLGLLALCASVLVARQISSRLQPLLLQQLMTKSTKRAL